MTHSSHKSTTAQLPPRMPGRGSAAARSPVVTSAAARERRTCAFALALLAAICLAAPASAAAAPELGLAMDHVPFTGVPAGGQVQYELTVSNSGDASTSGEIAVDFTAPPGLTISQVRDPLGQASGIPLWDCTVAPDDLSASCEGLDPTGALGAALGAPTPLEIGPGEEACEFFGEQCPIRVIADADPSLGAGEVTATAEASGGGASPANASDPTITWPSFALIHATAENVDSLDAPFTQAGGRPHRQSTTLAVPLTFEEFEGGIGGGNLANEPPSAFHVELPPGYVGNPTAMPRCSYAQLISGAGRSCPPGSQVGTVQIIAAEEALAPPIPDGRTELFNLRPPAGKVAAFGFQEYLATVVITVEIRSGEDYGVTATTAGISQLIPAVGGKVTLWGVPAEHGAGAPERPFLSLATNCDGPQPVGLAASPWSDPGLFVEETVHYPANTGCGALEFDPTLTARPTTNVADQPTGLEVELAIPQNEGFCDPGPPLDCGTATAHLKDVSVELPEGLAVNPASANGLGACTESQLGYTRTDPDGTIHTTPDPARCPSSSRLASVELESPALDHPLRGSMHLAEPYRNPFGSLLAIYLTVDDPASGVVVKLAGEVEISEDGQITTTFKNNPQLPAERISASFFAGPAAALRTPAACGDYATTARLTPWSDPDGAVRRADPWSIVSAPGGGECPTDRAALPHSPGFEAGTASAIAGAHAPFNVTLRRKDAEQRFGSLTVSPPPGLVAKLAGTPHCPEGALALAPSRSGRAEQASPSCPDASRIGTVWAAAGAGPAPYWAPGTAYLAGPYKSAPLSLAILAPAVAGPFDLGVVAVRTALHLDPRTAEITAVSDPIPSSLEGIPLDLRVASVRLDKPGFALNGTSCEPLAVSGLLASTLGAIAQLHNRFQLGECARLGFKPRLQLRLRGGVRRGKHQALRAVVRPRAGDANIGRTVVRMPRSAFLAQEHIRTVCTRVQFAAEACPKGSIYGRAIAYSPLLGYPLEGNVYLRSSDNPLPDLVADLRGPAHQPIRVELIGRTDSAKGALRNTFDVVPDAPVSYFRLRLFGGRKGLIVNSRNICQGKNRAAVRIDAQNGRRQILRPVVGNPRCRKLRRKAKRRRAAHKRRAGRGARRASLSLARRTG